MSASDLYSPLPEDSFRVLKILTADENEIICELQHFTFDEAPEYIALSYAVSECDPYGSNLQSMQILTLVISGAYPKGRHQSPVIEDPFQSLLIFMEHYVNSICSIQMACSGSMLFVSIRKTTTRKPFILAK